MAEQEGPSAYEQVTRNNLVNLDDRVERIEQRIETTLNQIFGELKQLRNRLPTWATLLLSFLFLVLGACLSSYFTQGVS